MFELFKNMWEISPVLTLFIAICFLAFFIIIIKRIISPFKPKKMSNQKCQKCGKRKDRQNPNDACFCVVTKNGGGVSPDAETFMYTPPVDYGSDFGISDGGSSSLDDNSSMDFDGGSFDGGGSGGDW